MSERTGRADRLLPATPRTSLEAYVAACGGQALATALEMEPDEVIAEMTDAGLRGRGGAGFPTGAKWRSVREAATQTDSPPRLVVNGAEGEPGTYKDRLLLATNPFQVLEGALIARHAVGADQVHIGVKAKTGHAALLQEAIDAVVAAGWEDPDVLHIVEGPDEYLFGEETGLLEVIEGNLPLPRWLPPFQQGLFATTARPHPTVVNNVETLANVPLILSHGAAAFRAVGTDRSPGTMLFTVVGDVADPGVYELPLGTPLRTLLVDIAGAQDLKAAYSGVSAAVITPDHLDTPLGFDEMQQAGLGLGSGGFIVYDTSRSMIDVLSVLVNFLAVESCGQCNACKLGTMEMSDVLKSAQRAEATQTDLERMLKRNQTVTDQNRCYLPVGAQLVVGSTVQAFADEFAGTVERGEATPADLPTPLIDHIDEDSGEVTYHPRYHLKQPDWSYADVDPIDERRDALRDDS